MRKRHLKHILRNLCNVSTEFLMIPSNYYVIGIGIKELFIHVIGS